LGVPFACENMDFYDSQKWIDKKNRILRRDKYMCQISKRYGKMVSAELVHHVFPRSEFPEYEFADWNLISITRRVHNRLHDRNTDELTEYGVELLQRIARKNQIPIPAKYQGDVKRIAKHECRARY